MHRINPQLFRLIPFRSIKKNDYKQKKPFISERFSFDFLCVLPTLQLSKHFHEDLETLLRLIPCK